MNRLQYFIRMAELSPQDAEVWYLLGKEYVEAGQHLKAISAFTEGLQVATEAEQRTALLEQLTYVTQQMNSNAHRPLEAASTTEQPVVTGPVDSLPSRESIASINGSSAHVVKSKLNPGLQVISGGKSEGRSVSERHVDMLTFADVAGLQQLKKTIQMKIISPFHNQGLFSKFRKKAGGGVLLYGPPGCGKTFIARATAGECQAKFIPVHITDILDPYIGVSEQNLKEIFDKARLQKPSVLFFDEVDAIGYNRSKSNSNLRGLVDTFLSQMEGIDTSTEHVLVMGATNMPWDVDQALKRPGRFDRLVFVSPPDEAARAEMFHLKLAGRWSEPINCDRLAAATELYSGADIEHVCERATEYVLEEILTTGVERPLQEKDLVQALQDVRPSTLEWLRTAKNYVKYANQSGSYNEVEDFLKRHAKHL